MVEEKRKKQGTMDFYADTMEQKAEMRKRTSLNSERGIFTSIYEDGLNREKGVFDRTALFLTNTEGKNEHGDK